MKTGGRLSSLCAVAWVAFLPACQTTRFTTPDEIVSGSCTGWHQVVDLMTAATSSKKVWEDALREFSSTKNEYARTQYSAFMSGWTEGEVLNVTRMECLETKGGAHLIHVLTELVKIGEVSLSFLVTKEKVDVIELTVYSKTVIIP